MLGAGSALLFALLKHVEEPKQKLSILVHQNGKTVNSTDKQHHAATPVFRRQQDSCRFWLSVIMVDLKISIVSPLFHTSLSEFLHKRQ